jgi:hypothetical protein
MSLSTYKLLVFKSYGFGPRQRQRIFPLTSVSRLTLRPTQLPIQWVDFRWGELHPLIASISRHTVNPPDDMSWRVTVELYWQGKPKNSEKNLSQCHSVHHKSHMYWTGRKPGPIQWVPGVLSQGMKRGRVVTLTTHHHRVQRSRMSRAVFLKLWSTVNRLPAAVL